MTHYDLTPDEADVFFSETSELIESLEQDLLQIEQEADDTTVHRVFRALHTLKGGAGAVGHGPMARLAHSAETLLDKVRNHEIAVTPGLVTWLLSVNDTLKQCLEEVVTDQEPRVDVEAVLVQMDALLTPSPSPEEPAPLRTPLLDEDQRQQIEEGLETGYNLLVVYAEAKADGVAPLARLLQVYMQLEHLGQVVASTPTVEQLEQGKGPLTLIAVALTELQRGEVEAELAQIFDLATLQVADMSNAVHLLFERAGEEDRQDVPEQAPLIAPTQPAQAEAARPNPYAARAARTVRTSVERLDALMNLSGELVTDRNRLFQIYEDLCAVLDEEHLHALNETISHLSTVTDRIHDEVFKARMQPIEYVFNKFPRFVRQTCQALGKEVELVMVGQDTEVDRSVIEHINDPLLHLIRNAIDHGIESVQERIAAGKPRVGRLELRAYSEEGNIVVTITDDGRGVDAEKVKAKAVRLGLITEEQAAGMSYNEAIDLIFAPGLSTAIVISDLSGRGVGMDVVRNNIQRLNGSVAVRSTPGKGTTFELRLPLTLAIIPTLLAEAAGQVFALPLHNVWEVSKLDRTSIRWVRGREMAHVREKVLPLIRLDALFFAPHEGAPQAGGSLGKAKAVDGAEEDRSRSVHGGEPVTDQEDFLVTLIYREMQLGVVVSKLLGKQDVVIKSLGHPVNNIRGLTGATFLGDGRIGFIVDVAALVEMSTENRFLAYATT